MYRDLNEKEWKKIIRKISKGHLLSEEAFPETILNIKTDDNTIIVISELDITKYTKDHQKLWQHEFHHDPIINAEIKNNKIHITELDETKYTLDIKTGKEIKIH